MLLKDISKNYGCRFEFEHDTNPAPQYMIINARGLRLGFVSFVDLNNGGIASFSEGDRILELPIRVKQ